MKRKLLTEVMAAVTVLGFMLAIFTGVSAANHSQDGRDPNAGPCFDNGTKVDTQGDPLSVTVTAPIGFLITSFCVKAGPTHEVVPVTPPTATVTITHSSGKAVSHFTVTYEEIPPSTTIPPTTTLPPTTTVPPTTVPPTTAPPTTSPPVTTTPPTTSVPPSTTLSTSTTPPPSSESTTTTVVLPPTELAFTGSGLTSFLLLVGSLLVLTGAALVGRKWGEADAR